MAIGTVPIISAAAPSGCTSNNPTISRYQVYRYEITNSLVNDWSNNQSDAQGTTNPPGNFLTENGVPYCAASNGVELAELISPRAVWIVVILLFPLSIVLLRPRLAISLVEARLTFPLRHSENFF
jgi:hypothetical protein